MDLFQKQPSLVEAYQNVICASSRFYIYTDYFYTQ